MILYNLKSDLQTIADLILSLNLVKWFLIMVGSQGNRKKNNYPQTLQLPCIILAKELLVYVDTF